MIVRPVDSGFSSSSLAMSLLQVVSDHRGTEGAHLADMGNEPDRVNVEVQTSVPRKRLPILPPCV
jgi:hypothetical protein